MGTNIRSLSWRRWGAAALMSLTTLAGVTQAQATPWTSRSAFALPEFATIWRSSDEVVASGKTARSYTW